MKARTSGGYLKGKKGLMNGERERETSALPTRSLTRSRQVKCSFDAAKQRL